MKIQVECLGLPSLTSVMGKKTEVEMAAGTVSDLITQLTRRYGQQVRRFLLDQKGELDLSIQVMINDEGFLARAELPRRTLKEGDQVRFLLLAGGG
ncbi:MAG: MoaD/ThiS family protein [Desulfobacterales bacterium]|nr:MAG: MoaD/ThiS family protein [Desulfobacterales bacterium]